MKIVHAGLEHLAEKLPWQQAGVFGEETEHDAIQEAGDAEVFALRETHFRAGLRISQLDGFAFLQRFGDFSDCPGQVLRDLRRGALRFEIVRIGEDRAENLQVFRPVNLVVGKLFLSPGPCR